VFFFFFCDISQDVVSSDLSFKYRELSVFLILIFPDLYYLHYRFSTPLRFSKKLDTSELSSRRLCYAVISEGFESLSNYS